MRKWQVNFSLPQFPVHLSIAAIKPFSTKTSKGPSSHRPWGKTTICAQMHKGAAIFEGVRSVKVNRGHSDLGTGLNFETRSEKDPGKEVTLTRAPAHIGENPGRWKSLRVCEFVGNFLTLYWRIKMLSSALRVGFSRVSMATKRCLVPTINAGIFVIVLDHTFRSSKTFVHVELAVRGYCGYTQGV